MSVYSREESKSQHRQKKFGQKITDLIEKVAIFFDSSVSGCETVVRFGGSFVENAVFLKLLRNRFSKRLFFGSIRLF